MTWKTKTLLAGVVLFVGFIGTNWMVLLLSDPTEAVNAESSRLGWAKEDQEILAGGHSSHFFSYKAYSRFRSRSRPEAGEIYVEVTKASPLHAWNLHEYRVENPDGQGVSGEPAGR